VEMENVRREKSREKMAGKMVGKKLYAVEPVWLPRKFSREIRVCNEQKEEDEPTASMPSEFFTIHFTIFLLIY